MPYSNATDNSSTRYSSWQPGMVRQRRGETVFRTRFLWVALMLLAIAASLPAVPEDKGPANPPGAGPQPPMLNFNPDSLDFGDVVVGITSPPQSTILENSGDGDAPDLAFGNLTGSGYDVDTGDCPTDLPAGGDCEVVITFTPPGTGPINPTLPASTPNQPPALLALSGNGIAAPPDLDLDPENLSDILQQGDTGVQTLTVSNQGDRALDWFVPEDLSEFGANVRALAIWDDGNGPALYVGGNTNSEFNGIARYDGREWSTLGTGVSGAVEAITVYDGALIVAGGFTEAGGATVNHIARWDGNRWSALDTGADATVYALGVYDGSLIAGGGYTEIGGQTANRIAAWNGNAWSPLGAGTDNRVEALTVYQGDLVAGGFFTEAGGGAANRLARWDGSQWFPLDAGVDGGIVGALTVYDGSLIAGGRFTEAGGITVNRVAGWDGGEWSALGTGMPGGVTTNVDALAVFGDGLIAGGRFSEAGGVDMDNIARWNGTEWSPLSGGVSGQVSAIAVFEEDLIAGGQFNFADNDLPARGIARWDGQDWSSLVTGSAICQPAGWLDAQPASGTLEGGESTQVTVIFDSTGLAIDTHTTDLCIINNDPQPGPARVPVTLTVTPPDRPVVDISPPALEFEIQAGDDANQALNIGNLGLLDLEWNIGVDDRDLVVFDDVNFTVPANQTGGSVQWHTGDTCPCDDTPFNFNMWLTDSTGELAFFWPNQTDDQGAGVSLDGSTYAVLNPGAVIGPDLEFTSFISPDATANWRSGGNIDGHFGFRFIHPDTGQMNYGHARIQTTGSSGHPATIVDWTYNQAGDPIAVGCTDPADVPWLSVDAGSGITPPESSLPVEVTVEAGGLEPGRHEAVLCLVTNDPEAPLVTIPVNLDVLEGPMSGMNVDPDSLSATVPSGQAETRALTISNPGKAILEWTVTEQSGDGVAATPASAWQPAGGDTVTPDYLSGGFPAGLIPLGRTGGGIDCENEPGLIIHDDGTVEQGYRVDPAKYDQVSFVDHFAPAGYPATLDAVCVAFISLGPASLDFEVVVFADDGPGGGPGSELGAMPATAEGIPVGQTELVWSGVDLSPLDLVLVSGGVHVGVRWAMSGADADVFIGADESPDNPVGFAGGFVRVDTLDEWFPTASVFPEYRSLFLRAAVPAVDCSLPDWLGIAPSDGTIAAGENQAIEVNLDAGDLEPGSYAASLCLASNAPGAPLVIVPVDLEVTEPLPYPAIDIDPAGDHDFGTVDTGGSQTALFTIGNIGNADLSIACDPLDDPAGVFATMPDPVVLEAIAPQDTATFTVACQPPEPGDYSATLSCQTNDPDNPEVNFGFACRGAPLIIPTLGWNGQLILVVLVLALAGWRRRRAGQTARST